MQRASFIDSATVTEQSVAESSRNFEQDSLVESLRQQNAQLLREKEQLQAELHAVINSKSWRFTSLLRSVAGVCRQVFPLWSWRRVQVELEAVNSVVVDGTAFTIIGPTPQLRLQPKEAAIPHGWISLRASLDLPIVAMLYYRTGETFKDRERVHLPLINCPRVSHVFYIPKGTHELRMDPFHPEGKFQFHSIELARLGSLQLLLALFNKYVGPALHDPKQFLSKARKLFAILREGGLVALRMKLFSDNITNNYQDWVKRYDTLSEGDREQIRERIEKLPHKPLISVVMPTYETPRKYLEACIESVRNQLYPYWELCIADDASKNPEVRSVLEAYAKKDARIKLHFRSENGHICRSTNDALSRASGEFIALLDHDDELTEHALYMVAEEINAHPDADFIYSDEDKITGFGMRFNPHFKSDWNPDLFLSQNYVCHLGVYRTSVVRELGGFRPGVEGAQDWDLAWRVAEHCGESKIRHIPHVLYHWRVIEGSTAQSTSYKPYVLTAQAKTIAEHLERSGVGFHKVEILQHISHVRPHFKLPETRPRVSIIIPTRDQVKLLARCIESLRAKAGYDNLEIIVIDNGSSELETRRYLSAFEQEKDCKVLRDTSPFNYSRLNNRAAALATGSVLGLLNNDLEALTKGWLVEMVAQLCRPGIGAVGARLLYPNNLLQHGGVIVGIGGVAGHNNKGRAAADPGYWNRAILAQNLSAVTAACMLVHRDVFERVNGLDEECLAVAFNDVDFCLKVRQLGYKIVYTPYAEFYHYESASRGYEVTKEKFNRFEREVATMKERWGRVLANDPYYNPNLTLLTEDFQLAFPPRANKPWRVERRSA